MQVLLWLVVLLLIVLQVLLRLVVLLQVLRLQVLLLRLQALLLQVRLVVLLLLLLLRLALLLLLLLRLALHLLLLRGHQEASLVIFGDAGALPHPRTGVTGARLAAKPWFDNPSRDGRATRCSATGRNPRGTPIRQYRSRSTSRCCSCLAPDEPLNAACVAPDEPLNVVRR